MAKAPTNKVPRDDFKPTGPGPRMLADTDILNRAITIVRGEKQRWEVATAFVTDRVSFKMRQLIRIFRKNYYGIFDSPIDQFTNLEKTWYPLSEINVEAVIAQLNIDQKDIDFRALTPDGMGISELTREAVKTKLSELNFEQKLTDVLRMMAIDGTAVWKTYEENGKLIVKLVDLLNIYIDPTTDSIATAYRFTERNLMFADEIKNMSGWMNTEDIDYNIPEGLPRTDPYWMNRATQVNSNVKLWDVYELWGMIPLSLITGNAADEGIEVPGHIVCSGIDSPGRERVHLIERNTKTDKQGNSMKPYEEVWYSRVPNRWYGRGVCEKLLTLQIYANIIFNVRINRSRVSQLGLFKMKKGAGVTPQMLARLPANGVVVLNNMDDLEQMVVQEVGESSYRDEDTINSISERLTNAFNVVQGAPGPKDQSATEASLTSTAAQTNFTLIKSGVAEFIERWMNNHALKIIAKELTTGQIIRITNDSEGYQQLVDKIVQNKALSALEESFTGGYLPSQQEMQMEIDRAKEEMRTKHTFLKLVQDVVADQLECKLYVNNDEMNIAVTIQNLMTLIQIAPEYRDQFLAQTVDLMGLPPLKKPQQMGMPSPMQLGPGGQVQQGPSGQPPMPQDMSSQLQNINQQATAIR